MVNLPEEPKTCVKYALENAFAVLVMTTSETYIQYVFLSDRRYKPHYKKIDCRDIDHYIECWQKAFRYYQKHKDTDKNIYKVYPSGHIVRVNSGKTGVSLDIWDCPITTQEELDEIIADYQKAKKMIPKLRYRLKKLLNKPIK